MYSINSKNVLSMSKGEIYARRSPINMASLGTYQGGLTAEQFLFSEIRIVSQMYLDGVSTEKIVQRAKEENLNQRRL